MRLSSVDILISQSESEYPEDMTPKDVEAKYAAYVERQFGKVVRAMREARGWSQTDLADRLGKLGFEYHQTTIGKLESGARPLRIGELFAMASVFDVTVEDLIASATGADEAFKGDSVADLEAASAELRDNFIEQVDAYVTQQIRVARRRSRALHASGAALPDEADPLFIWRTVGNDGDLGFSAARIDDGPPSKD